MRSMVRACTVALPLLASITTTLPAHAQSAVETVTYLIIGKDTANPNSGEYFRDEFIANGADELRFRLHSVRNGSVLSDLTITQVAPCQFTIVGQQFNSDQIIQRNTTLDFSTIASTQSLGEYQRFSNLKYMSDIKSYYFKVAGVKVCSKGEIFNMAFERSPASGTCRDQLQTWPFDGVAERDRQLAALNHLRTNFCKPRAF